MAKTMKGTIQGWRRKTKRGQILLENEEQLPFTFDAVVNAEKPKHIRNNMQVSVVIENGVIQSVTVEGLAQPIPQPLDRPHPGSFLNPYNFVRFLEQPTCLPSDKEPECVLWRCPPPPHERYVGLTGRIACQVEAVTPLFISDSHAITETVIRDEEGNTRLDAHGKPRVHRKYRFFTVLDESGQKQPAIPASSLRGMLRSVYEAITNSCYAIFDGERRLEFRELPEFGNRVKDSAAIVRRLATKDQPGQVQRCQIAKIGAYYAGEKASQNAQSPRGKGVRGWKSGEYVVARVWKTPKGRRIVREFAESESKLQPCGEGEEYISGWLKITGRGEGTQKLSETLFLDPEKHGSGQEMDFSYEQQEEYNVILQGQFERAQTPVSLKAKLSVGDLVWLEVKNTDTIRRLVRVQIPRTPYPRSLNYFLPEHLRICRNYDSLCPACRTFGWVYPRKREENIPDDKRIAYAGRVRLGHAKLVKGNGQYRDMTLVILSTPKPTTALFYLLNNEGQPDPTVDYRTDDARVHGRKFYRHHAQPNSQEYIRAFLDSPQKDHQNRTISGALRPGATFTLTLDFENLSPLELGALIYAMELGEGMYHRLGYAKPLGFGSVKITIDEVKVIDWGKRLQSLEPKAGWTEPVPRDQLEKYKTDFLKEMRSLYGDDFEQVVLADLRALLGEPPDLPIHYPRTDTAPTSDGKNFEWFVGNKRLSKAFPLPLAAEETGNAEGLPLLNKEGELLGK